MGVFNKHVGNILNKMGSDGTISGPAFQQLRTGLGTLSNSTDSGVKFYGGQIADALNNALDRSVSPEDADALALARTQYRRLKQIEPAINPDDTISPGKLFNGIDTKRNAGQLIYGQGDQQLLRLAQAGKNILGERTPNSGTPQRIAAMPATGGAIGATAELAEGHPEEAGKGALYGVLAPLAARTILEHPEWVLNPGTAATRTIAGGASRAFASPMLDSLNQQ